MNEFHQGLCWGHHSWKVTINNILREGYYCPTIFSHLYKGVKACHECHFLCGKKTINPLLNPISLEASFHKWGLDFIGDINPNSFGQHKWILTSTYYFTKWIESMQTIRDTNIVLIDILEMTFSLGLCVVGG